MKRRALQELALKIALGVPLSLAPLVGCSDGYPFSGPRFNCAGLEGELIGRFDDGGSNGFEFNADEDGGVADAGVIPKPTCDSVCGPGTLSCQHVTRLVILDGGLPDGGDADGGVVDQFVLCHMQAFCGGRRPEGLQAARPVADNPAGAFLAQLAHLEAASVPAFQRLAAELEALGAPAELVEAARAAAQDEVRHARVVGALARRHGGAPAPAEVLPFRERGLLELALENATEGCVAETYGALLAAWQARSAGDGAVRRAMAGVAADELRHADLAWAIDAWAESRLAPAERLQVQAARQQAIEALSREVARTPSPELVSELGLPTPAQAQAIVEAARQTFWAA